MNIKTNTISLVVIAKNEARCIERCLLSAKPFVDELIVLDTGSTDETALIAKSCGATVGYYPWQDDFAAARNASLELSNSEFNLILDADEWIEFGGENLRMSIQSSELWVGTVQIDNYIHLNGQEEVSNDFIERVLPRDVRYAGMIHEQPIHAYPRRQISIVVGHDGYLPELARGKEGRNERLLRLELKKNPEHPYYLYQLGKELENSKRFKEAAEYFLKSIHLVQPEAPWRHSLVIRSIFTLKSAKWFKEGLELIQVMSSEWEESADFHFAVGDFLLDFVIDFPNEANFVIPHIEASWKRCLEIGESRYPDSVKGRGSYLAAHNLYAYYSSLGKSQEAEKYAKLEMILRKNYHS